MKISRFRTSYYCWFHLRSSDKNRIQKQYILNNSKLKTRTYEIRSADADVDDVGDGLSGVALPVSGDKLFAELLHVSQHGVHLRGHVLAVDDDRRVRAVLHKKNWLIFENWRWKTRRRMLMCINFANSLLLLLNNCYLILLWRLKCMRIRKDLSVFYFKLLRFAERYYFKKYERSCPFQIVNSQTQMTYDISYIRTIWFIFTLSAMWSTALSSVKLIFWPENIESRPAGTLRLLAWKQKYQHFTQQKSYISWIRKIFNISWNFTWAGIMTVGWDGEPLKFWLKIQVIAHIPTPILNVSSLFFKYEFTASTKCISYHY